MVGCHHRLSGHEFEKTLGGGEGQESLVCCRPWDPKSWTRLSDCPGATTAKWDAYSEKNDLSAAVESDGTCLRRQSTEDV